MVHEHFHSTTTLANVLLEVIEDAVKGRIKTKFKDINTTVFKTISFIRKRCAALRGYQPGSDITPKLNFDLVLLILFWMNWWICLIMNYVHKPIWKYLKANLEESVDEDFEDNVFEEMEGSSYSTPGV